MCVKTACFFPSQRGQRPACSFEDSKLASSLILQFPDFRLQSIRSLKAVESLVIRKLEHSVPLFCILNTELFL